jgi:hypothetical protein
VEIAGQVQDFGLLDDREIEKVEQCCGFRALARLASRHPFDLPVLLRSQVSDPGGGTANAKKSCGVCVCPFRRRQWSACIGRYSAAAAAACQGTMTPSRIDQKGDGEKEAEESNSRSN